MIFMFTSTRRQECPPKKTPLLAIGRAIGRAGGAPGGVHTLVEHRAEVGAAYTFSGIYGGSGGSKLRSINYRDARR